MVERKLFIDFWKNQDENPEWYEILKLYNIDKNFEKKIKKGKKKILFFGIFFIGMPIFLFLRPHLPGNSEYYDLILGVFLINSYLWFLLVIISTLNKKVIDYQIANFRRVRLCRKIGFIVFNLIILLFITVGSIFG